MSRHNELKNLTLKQKLALNYVTKESKLTKIDDRIYSNTFTPYFPSPAYDRFLKGIINIASGRPTPVVVNFAVTAKCPCKCWHCSFADRPLARELSLEQLKTYINDVQDIGASVIGLTGGEPLLRDDLEEIISCIGERSMSLLFTTGYGLTMERVADLKKAGLGVPVISLDHYCPEVHDQGRGRQGMFDCAIQAIKLFKRAGFYTALSFVPDKKLVSDKEELRKVIEFFHDLGINDMRLTSPILSGHLTGKPEEKLSQENVETIMEIQRMCTETPGYPGVFAYDFFENEHYYGCGAGFNYLFIDGEGNACPCDFTMLSFGNIMERPVKEIWKEISGLFHTPGCTCYANKCSSLLAGMQQENWPLGPEDSKRVVEEIPPHDKGKTPEFWERLGIGNAEPE